MKATVKQILFLIIFIYLIVHPSIIHAQVKEDLLIKSREHYQQGEEYYSQGRYEEATAEFEKALEFLRPGRITFKESIESGARKAIAPPAPTQSPKEKAESRIVEEEEQEEESNEEKKVEGLETIEKIATQPVIYPEANSLAKEREYYLDIGDVLDISVWQIPDLSRTEVIVRPDGKISFSLVGDILAEGLTLTQLDDIITERLKTYVKSPEVSIMIRRFGERISNKIVVLGEIFGPGVYKFDSFPTIVEAIAAAGGYTKYAVLNSVMVIRGDIKAKPEVLRLNVAKVLKTGRFSQNMLLKPNDIVYVPRSFIGKINVFLEIFQPAINEYMQTLNARHLQHTVHTKGGI